MPTNKHAKRLSHNYRGKLKSQVKYSHQIKFFVSFLYGRQEAKVLVLCLGQAPKGYSNCTFRLLARQLVALKFDEAISHETVRGVLKQMA